MVNADSAEILLVEDNTRHVELMLRALEKQGLASKVFVVNDGAEALNFIFGKGAYAHRKDNLKVILLDLKIPKVNGLDVLREVKSDDRTKRLPVMVVTTSQHDRDVVESHQLGVHSYIVKPVNFNEFTQAVAEIKPLLNKQR